MASILDNVFTNIDNLLAPILPAGVTGMQFLSVFIIVYAIIFLVLSKVMKLFNENKKVQFLLALAISYFTASSGFAVIFITDLFPGLGITTMAIVSFLVVLAMVQPESKLKAGIKWAPLIVLISIAFIAYSTWMSMSGGIIDNGIPLPQLTQDQWFTIIFIGIVIIVILAVSLGGGEKKEGMPKWLSAILKMLKGED